MSFFDDASLAFLPSGAAGKDGKAYSIKPVPVFGSELVTNGDFASGSNGWSVSNGSVTDKYNASMSAYQSGIKITPFVQNGTFKVVFDLVVSSGSCKFDAGGSNNEIITTSGTKEIIITNPTKFEFNAFNTGWSGTLDNVSVKEVIVDGDFTFSRGSNLSATRIGPDGLIEKGRENLLLQSNNFGTTWQTINASVTSGQSGYDGSSNAWELDATAAGGRVYQNISSSGVHTFSIYAKKGTADGVRVRFVQTTDTNVYIDLRDGTLSFNPTNTIDVDIQDVSNGWYRITFALNAIGMSILILYPTDGTSSQVAGSIYIQDAQLEIGLAATDYIESGATTGKAGLLEDEPRFDYSGGATCPSLLLEPSRTNLAGKSEYIGGWGFPTNVTLTQNYGISPEGLTNSTRLQFTSNGFMNDALSQVNGTQYTLSIYAKRNDGGTQSFGFYVNGTPTIVGGITLTSDWQRFTYTYTASNSFSIGLAGSSGADVSVYGFQCEAGSYPTSYIPNHSGGTITRGADDCIALGLGSIAGQSEGTLFAYFKTIGDSAAPYISLNQNNGVANRVLIYNNSGVSAEIRVGGSVQASITSSTQGLIKAAFAYKANDFAFYINGSQIGTDSSGITFGAGVLNELILGFGAQDGAEMKQVLLFDTRLSNTDLATLTT